MEPTGNHGEYREGDRETRNDSEGSDPALPPISTLPPELLVVIFCICSKAELLTANDVEAGDYGKLLPAAMRLTHVCAGWRVVALGCPELWSIIQVHPRTTVALLEYIYVNSKDVLLSVNVCGPWVCDNSVADPPGVIEFLANLVRNGTHRFRSLTFDSAFPHLSAILCQIPMNFQFLEVLVILGKAPAIAGEDLSRLSTPSLRELRIGRGYQIDLSVPLLLSPHLTTIEGTFYLPVEAEYSQDPLHFLRSAGKLKRLTIRGYRVAYPGSSISLSIPGEDYFTANRPILDLPSLDYLRFTNGVPCHQVRGILRALRLPNAQVRLPFCILYDPHDPFCDVLRDLAGALEPGSTTIAPREICISATRFYAWKDSDVCGAKWWGVQRRKLNTFLVDQDPWITFPFFKDHVKASTLLDMASPTSPFKLSFANLTIFAVSRPLPEQFWTVLAGLESLEVLRVWWCDGQSELKLLEILGEDASANEAPPFPALKILMCDIPGHPYPTSRSIDLDAAFGLATDCGDEGSTELPQEALRSNWAFALDVRDALAVRRRRHGAVPLHSLDFMEALGNVLPDALSRAFKDITRSVVWDFCWNGEVNADDGRVRVQC